MAITSGVARRVSSSLWRFASTASRASRSIDVHVPQHADLSWDFGDESTALIAAGLLASMRVLPDFVTEQDEEALFKEIEPRLKRMRYEFDHWDNAIHGFRETERSEWSPSGAVIIDRIKTTAMGESLKPLPHVHILDLDAKGYIKPHVDAVRFCGSTVSGLCLLSPAVMRLRHSVRTELFADFLLLRRCLYIMSDSARYDFSHEVLKNEESFFKGQPVVRTRRISVIARNEPNRSS